MKKNNSKKRWVGTWAAAQQLVERDNMPPEPGLRNNTLRQIIRVSIAGEEVRLKLSNQYGNSSLEIKSAHLALAADRGSIYPETDMIVRFAGEESLIIPAGSTAVSDTLNFALPGLTTVAVSIYFGAVPDELTGHPGSRTTSFIVPGKAVDKVDMNKIVSNNSFSDIVTTDHWYILSGIDIFTVDQEKRAVVAIGDSITDGRGTTTNGNNRWTDVLAERLQQNKQTEKVGVLNQGIGGNAVLSGGLGPSAVNRFDRDVLEQSGVRYLVIFEGVNDIGADDLNLQTAEDLIKAYESFINKAHKQNILVYGATITPFEGSQYDNTLKEQTRQKVNEWIRTGGCFDDVIDFAAAVQDPDNHQKLKGLYDCGDHLHLSPAGYKRLAESIELSLFKE